MLLAQIEIYYQEENKPDSYVPKILDKLKT